MVYPYSIKVKDDYLNHLLKNTYFFYMKWHIYYNYIHEYIIT